MTIVINDTFEQGSIAWLEARRGLITASEMYLFLTPNMAISSNDKTRSHIYELAAQRINNHVEPSYIGNAMMRGMEEEIYARNVYSEKVAPAKQTGFITNDKFGFKIGGSPDGLVGDDGGIECKSRAQKHQVRTYYEYVQHNKIPPEYMLQIQTLLLITERKWWDFLSYSNGMDMAVVRVEPDLNMHEAIIQAASDAENKIGEIIHTCRAMKVRQSCQLFPTVRRKELMYG